MEDWRKERNRQKRLARREPGVMTVDVSFFRDLAKLGRTLRLLLEREGPARFTGSGLSADVTVMLNMVSLTFDLLCFVNADDTRDHNPDYRDEFSFVILPLLRTLIDGFYITYLLSFPRASTPLSFERVQADA